MYRLILLAFFMVSCTKQEPAPQKWNDWVKERKEVFQRKISPPSAVHFLYLPKIAPNFYLSKKDNSFKLSNARLKSDDTAYKVDFKKESLLDKDGKQIGDKTSPIQISERIFFDLVFIQPESKVRVFVYDLEKKDLEKKRKRVFFKYSKKAKHSAVYTKLSEVKTTKFQRSDGTTRDFNAIGTLKIENDFSFTVFAEPDQKQKAIMLMFKDATNGDTTYGAGRYLYVELKTTPNELKTGDKIDLDFNYTFNPPCAVSKGYHCPLPQDIAKFPIEGGEKYL